MKKKYLISYITLVFLSIVITAFFSAIFSIKYYQQEVSSHLTDISHAAQFHLMNSDIKPAEYQYFAENYSNSIQNEFTNDLRITLIAQDGSVLADSSADKDEMNNHLNRPEIEQAKHHTTGHNIRYSNTMKIEYMYAAVWSEKLNIFIRTSTPLIYLQTIQSGITLYTLLGMAAGALVSILIAYAFSKNITKPLEELTQAANRIQKGEYKLHLKAPKDDEIAKLSNAFNRMSEKIQITVSDFEKRNAQMNTILSGMSEGVIAVDNTLSILFINPAAFDLLKITKPDYNFIGHKLITVIRSKDILDVVENFSKDKNQNNIVISPDEDKTYLSITVNPILKSSSEQNGLILTFKDITASVKYENMRSDFVSNVTHELKTPLTSIRGFVETLKNGAVEKKDVAFKFLDIIDIEADRLHSLINDILQLSEIEKLKNEKKQINNNDINQILNDVIQMLKPNASKRNIKIINKENKPCYLNVNAQRFKQLFINLIDNGVKYNRDGGKVEVSIKNKLLYVNITIKDTGIGIPKQNIKRIFERFYRVDKGRSRSMGGTGLGLSIVKHIIQLYNGTIEVISKEGKGTEFTMIFPKEI